MRHLLVVLATVLSVAGVIIGTLWRRLTHIEDMLWRMLAEDRDTMRRVTERRQP